MDRRAFLSTFGVGALAGCTSSTKSSGTEDSDQPTPSQDTPTEPPRPNAKIVSESFDSAKLSYSVKAQVSLDGVDYVEAVIREKTVEGQNTRKKRFNSSGLKVLNGLRAGAEIEFNSPRLMDSSTHIVGTNKTVGLKPQSRFQGLDFSTIPEPDGEYFKRRYEWEHRGRKQWFEIRIPKALYKYCKSRPRVDKYGFYGGDSLNDLYIKNVAKQFTEAKFLSKREQVNRAISFVQSLKYTSDSVTAGYDEYQRYPVETLVDRGGDCEDTAILLGSILKHMGYDVRGVLLPGHMGISVAGEKSIEGSYYTEEGTRYYYIETTGSGWRLGDLADEYKGDKAQLVKLTGYPCLNFTFNTMDSKHGGNIFMYKILNSGDSPAQDVRFDVEFINKNGKTVTGSRYKKENIGPGESQQEMVIAYLPKKHITTKVRTSVYLNDELHARHETPYL